MNKVFNSITKCLLSFFMAIFMVSFAIAFVILFRPYYYLNISVLDLENETGYTYEEITNAYDDIMDYLVFGDEFKTGNLKYSEEGKAHFEDCKKLFSFDFICLFISTGFIVIILLLQKYKKINLEYKHFSPGMYALFAVGSIFLIFIIWGCISFDSLFTTFHKIAFPGKDNWMFDPWEDQIIDILPTELWINFCILIVFILLIFISIIIVLEIKRKRKNKLIN